MPPPEPLIGLADSARARPPQLALVLGSGMGQVANRVKKKISVPFFQVPGLVEPSVNGHEGWLTLGDWLGKSILVFEGRLHFYEGNSWQTVVWPVQIAQSLGARVLLLTNAAGGIHPALVPDRLMAIRDHIEWTVRYSWRQSGPGSIGPPRPSPYSTRLLQLLTRAALNQGMEVHQGFYAAVTGPNYETPAEIRALQACGADAVGMSTAREAQLGFDLGLECAALSLITNRAAGLGPGPIHHEEVLVRACTGSDHLAGLIEEFLKIL